MKGHPLAQGDFQGAVVEPAPPGRQARHQLAILVELEEVLEDVLRNPRPVQGVLSTMRSSPRGAGGCSPTLMLLHPEGDEHQDDAANNTAFS